MKQKIRYNSKMEKIKFKNEKKSNAEKNTRKNMFALIHAKF